MSKVFFPALAICTHLRVGAEWAKHPRHCMTIHFPERATSHAADREITNLVVTCNGNALRKRGQREVAPVDAAISGGTRNMENESVQLQWTQEELEQFFRSALAAAAG